MGGHCESNMGGHCESNMGGHSESNMGGYSESNMGGHCKNCRGGEKGGSIVRAAKEAIVGVAGKGIMESYWGVSGGGCRGGSYES